MREGATEFKVFTFGKCVGSLRKRRVVSRRRKGEPAMSVFSRNVHPVERVLRVLIGVGVLSLAFVGPATPWGYLGIIPILTGVVGNCPLYGVCGKSTCPTKKAD